MKLTTCNFTLAGEQMFGARDENGSYYVAVTEIDALFTSEYPGYNRDFTQKKLSSQSMKLALGADVHAEKIRVGRSTRAFLRDEHFVGLLEYLAFEENSTMARALFKACAVEAIQRRIDNVIGVKRTEADYEQATAELYRRLRDEHRICYRPYFTEWAKLDKPKADRWFYINRIKDLKKALGLPKDLSVNDMTTAQLLVINNGELRYDSFRRAGLTHDEAMAEVISIGV